MDTMWYLNMASLKKKQKSYIYFLYFLMKNYEGVPQTNWYLNDELYHLISKNQKLNFVLFLIINKLKCMHDFNAQWHFFSEL